MPRTQEVIKKDDRFWAAVLPYVLHSVLKKSIFCYSWGTYGWGKKCTELNTGPGESWFAQCSAGSQLYHVGLSNSSSMSQPRFWAYTVVTQVGSLMRFGEGCLNHILSGLQHPTFSCKDSLSPWDLELCFPPNRLLVVPLLSHKTQGELCPALTIFFSLRTAEDADLPWIQDSPGVWEACGWFPSLLEQIWLSFSLVNLWIGLLPVLSTRSCCLVRKIMWFCSFFAIFIGKTFFLRLIK